MQVLDVKDSRNRYLKQVLLEDGSVLTLPVSFVQKKQITAETSLTEEEIRAIRQDVLEPKIRKKTLDYLSKRVYGYRELCDKLIAFGFLEPDVRPVLDHYLKLGYLNDENFARCYVHDALLLKRQPIRRIRYDLAAKGVAQELVEAALAEYDGAEYENIGRAVEKECRSSGSWPPSGAAAQKIKARLCRRGFSLREVERALAEAEEIE